MRTERERGGKKTPLQEQSLKPGVAARGPRKSVLDCTDTWEEGKERKGHTVDDWCPAAAAARTTFRVVHRWPFVAAVEIELPV